MSALQVVAVLNGAGAILGIQEDLLGATVLAWGETLPDLVAMLAVARAGKSSHASAVDLWLICALHLSISTGGQVGIGPQHAMQLVPHDVRLAQYHG